MLYLPTHTLTHTGDMVYAAWRTTAAGHSREGFCVGRRKPHCFAAIAR